MGEGGKGKRLVMGETRKGEGCQNWGRLGGY